MTLRSLRPLACLPLVAALALAFAPTPAEACGGTFCDGALGPNVMPVDQTGENILFWIDHSGTEPHTEAHIQIQYEGDAENFAWIIPVQQVPEVLVGNQALFDNLLAATVPTFTITTNFQSCPDSGPSVGLCAFGNDAALAGDDEAGGSFSSGGDEAGDGTGGPEILDRGFAGAFEYVVLTGDSVQEIVDWLDMAGYAQDDDAPPILQEYLDDDFVFVAVKLRGGVDVDEIHPLAIRYPGVEPCIPIKLTRIAAVDDMAIRAFFLGESRAAPMNWPHIVVNPVRLDWVANPAVNYLEIVSLALDEAGGRAFLTEYAGTDAIVSTNGVDSPAWDPTAFEAIEPVDVVDELIQQGLGATCDDFAGTCVFPHPQVEPLLAKYLPAPANLNPYEFWGDLHAYEGLIDLAAWSGTGFATDFAERISTPGQHAIEMLESASYLTRLMTLLSPHEMIEDPTFHETDSLPPVDNSTSATRTIACEGNDWIDLADGRQIALTDVANYPDIEGMPAVEIIEQIPAMGPPQVSTDNRSKIDELLAEWNHGQLEGPAPWNCSVVGLQAEALLTMLSLFGLAWLHRGRRRRISA
ncbi:DUF2330 domain-containing protein [Nannocystaceae bacterium ST9]